MNLKLKAALLTLGVMLGFAGFVFVVSLFPIVAVIISSAVLIGLSATAIYLFIYGMIGDEQ
jgi:hypothetical protein